MLLTGSMVLAALLGMSVGTALLPATAQVQNGLLVAGGLLLLLGSERWLLHVLRDLAPPQTLRTGRRGRREP